MVILKRLGLLLVVLGLAALGSLGLYLYDEYSHLPEQLAQDFPVLEGPLELAQVPGEMLIALGDADKPGSSGFLLPMVETDTGSNQWERQKEQISERYPVLKGGIDAAGKAGRMIDSTAEDTYDVMRDYYFPDSSTRLQREQAKHEITRLHQLLAARQAQASDLEYQIERLQGQINTLEKTANPLKKLVPDGVNFLGIPGQPGPMMPNILPKLSLSLPKLNSSSDMAETSGSSARQPPLPQECSCP